MSERNFPQELLSLPEIQDSREMIMVTQHTWGVTTSEKPNPVLKTFDLSTCVAVGLHDPETTLTGLLHMDMMSHFRHTDSYHQGPFDDIAGMFNVMNYYAGFRLKPANMTAYVSNNFGLKPHMLSAITKEVLVGMEFNKIITIPAPAVALDSRSGNAYRLTGYNNNYERGEFFNNIMSLTLEHPAVATMDRRSMRFDQSLLAMAG